MIRKIEVRFYLRPSKNRSKPSVVYGRIYINGDRSTAFSTFIKCYQKDWDEINQRIIEKNENDVINNQRLEQYSRKLNALLAVNESYTCKDLLKILLDKPSKPLNKSAKSRKSKIKKDDEVKLIDLMDEFIKESKKVRTRGTHKNYMVYRNNILECLKHYNKDNVLAKEISRNFIESIRLWNIHRLPMLCDDSISKVQGFVKQVLGWAANKGILETNPLEYIKIKRKQVFNATHLTQEELEILMTTSWNGKLKKVVDAYVFCCYTGLAYCDVIALKTKHLVEYKDRLWIKKPRQKTDVLSQFPLHETAYSIIKKYGSIEKFSGSIVSNTKYNKSLKEIARIANIDKRLTSHTARKTFINYSLNDLGYSSETVATMVGHSDTRMLKKHYARINEKRIHNEVQWGVSTIKSVEMPKVKVAENNTAPNEKPTKIEVIVIQQVVSPEQDKPKVQTISIDEVVTEKDTPNNAISTNVVPANDVPTNQKEPKNPNIVEKLTNKFKGLFGS